MAKKLYVRFAITTIAFLVINISFLGDANSATKFLPRSAPTIISIPSLGVSAKFIKLGLDKAGALEVPKTADIAGWFTGAPTPGELGPAIIAAHVDMGGKLGIFFRLKEMKKGDLIYITRLDSSVVTFKVTQTATYLKANFPTEKVYGDISFSGLRLITCGGKFDPKIGHYLSNVVVFASMVN